MSARPNTDAAQAAEAQKPGYERPMGRRTLLRAMIITVPVVAAFARNASAATDGHGCRTGFTWCAICSKCLVSGDNRCQCKTGSGNNGCLDAACQQSAAPVRTSSVQGDNAFGSSPFQQGQSAISDGGFNSSPWQ